MGFPFILCFLRDFYVKVLTTSSLGSSLIRRRDSENGIEFAHFTVKEYLLSIPSRDTPGISIFALSKNEANLNIGQTCLTYILFDDFGKAPPSDAVFQDDEQEPSSLFARQLERYPLYLYAANEWLYHLNGQLKGKRLLNLHIDRFAQGSQTTSYGSPTQF